MPFLSTLAPSERYAREHGKRHKKFTEWAWQLLLQLRRWQPEREIVAVADGTYAALELLVHLQYRFWVMNCSAAYELAKRTCRVFGQC